MAVSGELVLLMQLINISFPRADFHIKIPNFNLFKNYNHDQELKQYCIL